MQKRFFYDIDKKKIYIFDSSHACYFANNKAKLKNGFDGYIRGIIENNILYLRLFYPYDNIDEKSFTYIKQVSFTILKQAQADILEVLKNEGINISDSFLNVDNELLKEKLKLAYV